LLTQVSDTTIQVQETAMRQLLLWVILLVIGFFLGFIPQYMKAHVVQEHARTCEAGLQLAQFGKFGALTYISATQLNYGMASGYAQQFFEQAQRLASSTSDPAIRNTANEISSARDKISADLAKGNAAVLGELQPIVLKVELMNP
jgi:heme/copper-type cytochrome/quinol oxidase subunit 1